MRMVWILAAGLCLPCSAVGQPPGASSAEERPLSNQDVISLARAGLGDDVVVAKIRQAAKESLDVSTEKLIALKKAGLTKPVIEAMVKRVAQRSVPTPTPVPTLASSPIPQKAARSEKSANSGSTASKAEASPESKSGRPCMANFKSEGGYWKGEIFRDSQEFTGVDKGKAFDRVAQTVASMPNMVITSTSKETGMISGSATFSPVMGGAPRPAPLGVVFKEGSAGSFRIEIQFNVPSGCKAVKSAINEALCTILEAAQQ